MGSSRSLADQLGAQSLKRSDAIHLTGITQELYALGRVYVIAECGKFIIQKIRPEESLEQRLYIHWGFCGDMMSPAVLHASEFVYYMSLWAWALPALN